MKKHIINDRDQDVRTVKTRLMISAVVMVVLTVILLGRFFVLQVTHHDQYRMMSLDNQIDLRPLPPVRGMIFDRYGMVLAENQSVYELEVIPENVNDMDRMLSEIGMLVELTDQNIRRFRRNVKQRPRFESQILKSRLTDAEAARFAVRQHQFPGVTLSASLRRVYPQKDLAGHVVGYVGRVSEQDLKKIDTRAYKGTSYIGKIGIESFYETELLGQVGVQQVETDAYGRVVRQISHVAARAGTNVYLTLDVQLQKVAIEALGERRGAVVALEPSTGDILAFVSTPTYDPNLFAQGISHEAYGNLRGSVDKPLVNRALYGRYAPGSTIKPLLALAALEHGLKSQEKVLCTGRYALPGSSRKYRCWRRKGHGYVNLHDALAQSCDVFFYELAHSIGIRKMADYFGRFGFGRQTGIDLLDEPTALLPTPEWKKKNRQESWYPGETIITGIGQGYLLVTPLQLAYATATLANRGRAIRPRLLRGLENPGSGAITHPAQRRGLSVENKDSSTWDRVIAGMESVLHGSRGTARASGRNSPYRIAGKTGTAQVVSIPEDWDNRSDELPEELRDHALFIAFAPVEQPRIAIAVVVENGGSGSRVAAPIARKIMDYYFIDRLRRASLPGIANVFG